MPLSFIIYFAVLIAIGLVVYFNSKQTESDFVLGDRSLNYWVTAISAQSSDMGAWLFLGLPAIVYTTGMFEIWTPVGLVFCMYLTWQFIAPKLRAATEHYGAYTLWTFFDKKFNDTRGHLRLVCALLTIYFFVCYVTVGLVGLGLLFESAFGLEYTLGVLLAVCVTVGYTLIGGFLAVSWCNLFQGLFLLAMIVVVPYYAFGTIEGWGALKAAAQAHNVSLAPFSNTTSIFGALLKAAGWGLGYFGLPHLLVNFMGIDDVRNISKAKIVGITWQIIVLSCSVLIGLIALPYFKAGVANPDHIFSLMVKDLFSPLVAGFALCAVLAATLSTINTQIIVAATTITEDIVKQFYSDRFTDKQMVWITRWSTIGMGLVSTIGALYATSSIYALTHYAWAGLGAAFGPLVILSLYAKNIKAPAALFGLFVGTLTVLVWPYLSNVPEAGLVVGFTLNLVLTWTCSQVFAQAKLST